jgi:NitT/TauT family transport system substrate-binding protein
VKAYKDLYTGPQVFEAMAAGKLDVLSAGGVISNYLALGAGRAFLINDVEVATAQLWVRPDRGVKTFADLRGKRVATTAKTISFSTGPCAQTASILTISN